MWIHADWNTTKKDIVSFFAIQNGLRNGDVIDVIPLHPGTKFNLDRIVSSNAQK